MKIHYLSENTPSGALVSMDYGGPSCVMVTQMLLSVTDVEPRERHGVTLTKNMHNQADDLTAERAAAIKLYEKVLSYSPDPEAMAAGDDKDFEAILHALKTARREALREAARQTCMYCSGNARGYTLGVAGPNSAGNYTHEVPEDSWAKEGVLCKATSIWSLIYYEDRLASEGA